jgi:hypothetical protein
MAVIGLGDPSAPTAKMPLDRQTVDRETRCLRMVVVSSAAARIKRRRPQKWIGGSMMRRSSRFLTAKLGPEKDRQIHLVSVEIASSY